MPGCDELGVKPLSHAVLKKLDECYDKTNPHH
jgi:hypothetical protein